MSYSVISLNRDGNGYEISSLISSIKWGGDIQQAARKLELTIALERDSLFPKVDVPLGSILILKNNQQELFRGVVFDRSKGTDGSYQVTAFDHLIYLLKSKGTYIFRSMTADAIIKKLCSDFSIPIGNIPNTEVVLPKLILRDMSIYDMCLVALTETMKRNGQKYMIRMKEGKLNVIVKAHQQLRWVISEGSNLSSASYSENINDMKNRIVIVGDKDQVLAQVEDKNLISMYGLLQEIKKESNITTGAAQTIAKNMLKELGRVAKEASIMCLGLDDVEAGSAIEVKESITGLTGTFYVDTDDHTIENNQHTMSLKLNWTDEVAMKEATNEQQ